MSLKIEEIGEIEQKIREKDLYTTKEAADCLHVFSTTVINWVEKGYINCFLTPGGHRKIPAEELLSFVRSHNFHRNLKRKKPRILVVEDDEDARNLCVRVLGHERYEIRSVENGFFAGIVKEFKPDLILLDIMLPDIDGEQVCQFIRKDPSLQGIKIMAISAITDPIRIESLFAAGIDDYLAKPYKIEDLEKHTQNLLQESAVFH